MYLYRAYAVTRKAIHTETRLVSVPRLFLVLVSHHAPPFVRAAAYLYEPSSRRLKWSEPYPRPPLSPRRTGDDVSTVSIQGHRSPRRRIPWTNYHEPSLLLSSHNDSVSLDNERSIDRPVILGVKSLSYFDGRWKSGRWVGDYW